MSRRQPPPPTPLQIPISIPMIMMALTMMMSAGHLIYTSGVLVNRIVNLEESSRISSTKIESIGTLSVDIATLKATLNGISTQLLRMERQLDKKGTGG